MFPWLDRSGRFSPLKAATLAATFVPAGWLLYELQAGRLGAEPLNAAIHESGQWALRLLLVSLAISPLRRIAGWSRLILVRRIVGLAALAYAVLHLGLYVASVNFDLWRAGSEIVLRYYLAIGFAALLILSVLGATSFDRAIRRLGRRWQTLHRFVYGAAFLALVHHFLQAKADVSQPVLMSGLFLWLMAFRWLDRAGGARPGALGLLPLALLTPLATAAIEALWYYGRTGIDPWRILQANWSFVVGMRPAGWVLVAASAMVLLALARPLWERAPKRRPAVTPSQAGEMGSVSASV